MAVQYGVWYKNPLLKVVPALEGIDSILLLLHGRSLCGLKSHGWAIAERMSWERARMQAQAVLYLLTVPYLIATEIAATRQEEGREEREKSNRQRNQTTGLWAGLGRGLVTI